MSTQAKIHCHNCGCNYYVYWSGLNRNKIINCPHCFAKIDKTMWDNLINAMSAVENLNSDFIKYNADRNENLFDVSIENVYVPADKLQY